MSMDYWEAEQESAYASFMNALSAELYEEHRDRAINDFVYQRLKSYYSLHPNIAKESVSILMESRNVFDASPTASLMLSASATEVLIKNVLLKPIVYGSVHRESLANLISEMLANQTGIDKFRNLLFGILSEFVNFGEDFKDYKRSGSKKTLWEERSDVHKIRNKIAHEAILCSASDARLSLGVAECFYGIIKLIIEGMEYRITKEGIIVNENILP